MEEMRAQFPAINQGISRIKNAWSDWASNFAAEAGPGLGRVLNSLAQQMETFDFGTPMGRAMGGISDAFASVLSSPGVTAFFRSLTQEYPRALEAFGAGAANVFSALSSLLAGAAPAAERLGEMFRSWSAGLAESAEEARKSGAMREVFDRVADSVSAVMGVIRSLGRAIGAVFMATSDHGNDLLNSFSGLIDRFTDWVKSAEGQQRINEWLETGKALLPAMGNLVSGLARALSNLVTPKTISLAQDFLTTLGEWLPKFSELLEVVANLDILGNLANFLNMVSDAAAPLMPHLSELATIIGETIAGAIEKASPLFEALADAAEPLIERFTEVAGDIGPQVVDAIDRISTSLAPVIEILGQVANVVQAVVLPALQWLVEGIINGVVDAVEGLSQVFVGVVDTIKALFAGDWSAAWESFKSVISGAIQAVWGILQVWILGRIMGIIRGLATSAVRLISSGWQGLVNIARTVWTSIWQFIQTAWTGILGVVTAVGAAVWGFIEGAWNTIWEITTSVWNSIVEAISAAWDWILETISTVMTSITDFLVSGWEFIMEALNVTWDAIKVAAETVWNGIKEFFSNMLEGFKIIFTTAWEFISTTTTTVWEGIKSFFTTVWEGIKSVISTAVESVKNVITNVWNTIKDFISTVMNGIRTTFSTIWNAIKSVISDNINNIRSTISTVWNAIKSFISTVMNGIRSTFSSIWNAIKSTISSVINSIKSTISSVWNSIKSTISSVMSSIRSTISSIWNSIRSTIRSVVNGIRSVISSVWNSIRSTIRSVMNSIRSTISSIWNGIRSTISSVVNGIRNAVSSGFNGARNAAVNAFNSMRNAVSSTINGLLSSVRNAARNIMSAFRNIIGNMRTIGRNIITGLINGVGSMGNALWNAARRVAQGAMNAIKGLFGINSPSREMRKVGVWIGEGFNLGMGDEEKNVARGMERLGEAAMGGMDVRKYMNAGTDAAEAFANGLSSVDVGALEPGIEDVSRRAGVGNFGSGRPREGELLARGKGGTTVESGAIQVTTPAQDGRIVAGQMLDELVKAL